MCKDTPAPKPPKAGVPVVPAGVLEEAPKAGDGVVPAPNAGMPEAAAPPSPPLGAAPAPVMKCAGDS